MKRLELPMKELFPLIRQELDAGREVYITVRGSSMSPFLQDGRDQAVFAPLGERTIRRGDIVFYERPSGQMVMHRVYAVDAAGVMTLLGDAQCTPETGVRPDQLRAFVPRVVRCGREISCEKGLWHAMMKMYQLRVRHPLLGRGMRRAMGLMGRLARLLRRGKERPAP